ncbi:MAG: HipA N-terminal domain-containing protein [Methylacidiphilales bacterium]|nr:HipA N-terminal domain-containing protein [Candidatus Methylacidiphilales bacterium]
MAGIYQQGVLAGFLEELGGDKWRFSYSDGYSGESVSLTMPVSRRVYDFDRFPPAFEGLLPEGMQLEAMLRRHKLDGNDLFGQLKLTGQDLVGSLTVKEIE